MYRRTMMSVLAIALVGALALIALIALAAERPGEDPAPLPARTVEHADPSAVSPRYTADELALLAIQEEGRRQVRELAARLKTEVDPTRRDELQREIVALKEQSHLLFLRALAEFARERGDLATEQQALAQIDNLTRPRQAPAAPVRQTPGKVELQRGGE